MSEDLAWAAGFFDGEGSTVVIHKNHNISFRMAITQKHPEVLYKLQSAVGVGKVYLSNKIYKGHKSKLHRWQTTNHVDTIKAMEAIWPFLGSQKREQYTRAKNQSTWHDGMKDKLICKDPSHVIEKRENGSRRCRTCKLAYNATRKRRRDIIRFASRIALGYSHPRMFGYCKKTA
jgi:hypothetical protein